MNQQQRYEILSDLCSTAHFDQYGVTFQNPLLQGDEALYAIPEYIVDAISNSELKLMSADEIELEKFFAGFCRRVAIVGFAVSGGVRFPLLQPLNREATAGLSEKYEAHQRSERFATDVIDQFTMQRLAFLGWLLNHAPFQEDRLKLMQLWQKHGSNPSYLQGRNHLRQYSKMPEQAKYSSGLHPELCNDFLAFYRKWDLSGLATWDLPLQQEANLGGPEELSQLMEIDQGPTIKLPTTMKLPSKLPLQEMLEQRPADHLAPWREILNMNQTKRWAEGFVIHYYQDIILRRIFGQALHRCQGELDSILAHAFRLDAPIEAMEKMDVDTVKKVRQAFQRSRQVHGNCHPC